MDMGRVHCFLAATKAGQVIYERFFDRLSEQDKAEARGAMHSASTQSPLLPEQDYVGFHRGAVFVFLCTSDVVLYLMGSGQYEELALATLLHGLLEAARDVMGKAPSEAVLLEHYAQLALLVEEAVVEGVVETTDKDRIRKGTKSKALWEQH